MLLIGAGLMLRSFHALSRVDTGIDTRNLLAFDLFLTGDRAQYQQRQVAFYDDALRLIGGLPGVTSAGAAVTLPIGGDDFAAGFFVEGRPQPPPGQEPRAGYQVVTPGYFRTMGIPITSGRDFRAGDTREAPPVVMINATMARQQWPGQDPIGRRLKIGSSTAAWMTVVGVTGDIRHLGPATPPRPEFYQPHSQNSFPFMAFVVRTAGPPEALVPAIRSAVTSLDSAQPISGVNTMETHIANALARPRFLSLLVAAFGAAGAGAGDCRDLRRDGLRGHAAHAGDSHPLRARRIRAAGDAHGAGAGGVAGAGRHRHRSGPHARRLASARRACCSRFPSPIQARMPA